MPYVSPDRRRHLTPRFDHGRDDDYNLRKANGPGELNYQITYLLHMYMVTHGLNYRVVNDIIGALEGAKLEFYRRVASPYEDNKIFANGDVYTGKETNGGSESIPQA